MSKYDKRESKALQGTIGLLIVILILIIKHIFEL